MLIRSLIIAALLLPPAGIAHAQTPAPHFKRWLQGLRIEALAAGISPQTLDQALLPLQKPLPGVLELDRNQPEFKQSLADYVANRVNNLRVVAGKKMRKRYPTWLDRIEEHYGVQRRFILALWGIETGYGRNSGSFPVIASLATLAYDGRRADYFRAELLQALRILDRGHIPLQRMKGSWAGAMGQCQFMPSAFHHYATDADGDGRSDIWSSVPDVLASTANYLARAGWQPRQNWGEQVRLRKGFDRSHVGLATRLPLSRWQDLGVLLLDRTDARDPWLEASLILPDGEKGPAYLVYDNFRVLRRWNRSNAFAIAVGTLADRIAHR